MQLTGKLLKCKLSLRKKNATRSRTLGSVLMANGIPVITTALPAWSAKSSPSLT